MGTQTEITTQRLVDATHGCRAQPVGKGQRVRFSWRKNSCTLQIRNVRPADSGNYLSRFKYETPGFKKVLIVEGDGKTISNASILIICLSSVTLLGLIAVYLYSKRAAIYNLVKENLRKLSNSEKVNTEPEDQLEILSPVHVA